MEVSTHKNFQIVYSLFEHEYLGYLFESFLIQLEDNGRFSLIHQNISTHNAKEFSSGLDQIDYELIDLMDSIQQEYVVRKFYKKQKIKPDDFFIKYYEKEIAGVSYKEKIQAYLEKKRNQILELIQSHGKKLFEMGNDGEPATKEIEVLRNKAKIDFVFYRNLDNTQYFPSIEYNGEKLNKIHRRNSYMLCREPAWLIIDAKLFSFKQYISGKKFLPFLKKQFIDIPKVVEYKYFKNFVCGLIANYPVDIRYGKGNRNYDLKIVERNYEPKAHVYYHSISREGASSEEDELFLELIFSYDNYEVKSSDKTQNPVELEFKDACFTFHKTIRNKESETKFIDLISESDLKLEDGTSTIPLNQGLGILKKNKKIWEENGIQIIKSEDEKLAFYLGEASIEIEVKEQIDWFDIGAKIKFGDYEVSFIELRNALLNKESFILLPSGERGLIPEEWKVKYTELIQFLESPEGEEKLVLKKHHLGLLEDLESDKSARVSLNTRLEKLRDFETIENLDLPKRFKGELRSYQQAGYNWMNFLNQYKLGGCLADDMGLGKTVQTLALLQNQKEAGTKQASLLIMPTSLVYNWEMEAKQFTPDLKVFCYTGTNRIKDPAIFQNYDLILTSYGIARIDSEILSNYLFHYIILDESQTIKNPNSITSKGLSLLKSNHKLILTGTPLENSTMDLWAQINFINPGLLGTQKFFKKEYLTAIEKKGDQNKAQKLSQVIKPFILRRLKSQVASELPDKVEQVKYTHMVEEQKKAYDDTKEYFRNKILDEIEKNGVRKSQFLLLQGLTKLRQIANHPRMTDIDYSGGAGKFEELKRMLKQAMEEGHKILVFSQFVKHLSIVMEYLQLEKIDYAYLDGNTKDRKAQVERFQKQEDLKVFLISLKAGGVGLNLTKADYVFILDPWWNPAIEAQAVDRAHRIGQSKTVFTYKFIGKDTVEEKILALQTKKRNLAGSLINTDENFIKELSKEDIQTLLD